MLAAALAALPAMAQAAQVLRPDPSQTPAVQTTVNEVLLDLVVRDKKGKPVTDLKPGDLTVLDNGAKQTLTSFRLVSGSNAVTETGASTALDPMRQVRLVTLAFDALSVEQRKLARTAALDLIRGQQGGNVFYSVVVIDTRILALQPFTKDPAALTKAIERATEGLSAPRLSSESDAILDELKRQLNGQTVHGADQDTNLRAAASQAASQPVASGAAALQARLASIMLDILRLDAVVGSQGTRLTLSALESLVDGLRLMPGRKSVLYFTAGMYLTPELDVPFRNVLSMANRNNVTFYAVDTRGVMTRSQNAGATSQLNGAAASSKTTILKNDGAVTKDEVMSSDNAEVSGRANIQLAIRDLSESTGGFLIGDSNDLRVPLRQVNEEISSYYEVSFNPGIKNFDGSFRKLTVNTTRKDLVIHARVGYFALPPEARTGLKTFEVPLLKLLSDGKTSADVKFRAGPVLLQPKASATDVAILLEVPLHELQPKTAAVGAPLEVHCSLAALVKDSQGEVVQKITRDRSFQVTSEQFKLGNFLDKTTVALAPGKYTLESAVMDNESGKVGTGHAEFTVPAKANGVSISSLTPMRSYVANAKGLDPNEPFQFQGGSVTPTLDQTVKKGPNAVLRLFFTVYPDASIPGKPTVEVEFLQNGQSLTKVPMQLPDPDAQGRIPYLMTIPAEAIPPGSYEIHATARQGSAISTSTTTVRVEAP